MPDRKTHWIPPRRLFSSCGAELVRRSGTIRYVQATEDPAYVTCKKCYKHFVWVTEQQMVHGRFIG